MTIAIIGTGIAGLGAAHRLHPHHDIVLYEQNDRTGGHANTVEIEYDGKPIRVDTGFIVFNTFNYPLLTALFEELGVPVEQTDMSFAVSLRGGRMEWCGDNLRTIFAKPTLAASPRFLWMLRDILRFFPLARKDLESGRLSGLSMGDYIAQCGFGKGFRDDYILPMGAAIWSTPELDILDFPAESFLRFFNNHRLLGHERPLWNTVSGGSRAYVDRLTAPFRDRIFTGRKVTRVERLESGVGITDSHGEHRMVDQVILACHSDEALAMLADPDPEESRLLGALRYAPNTAYLHKDQSLMPKRRLAWAAWNTISTETGSEKERRSDPVCVTYWMNKLQNLDPDRPLFVTLNPAQPPKTEDIFGVYTYDHPQFDGAAIAAQQAFPTIQGRRRTWFAGAYCGYGFHEDGLMAGYRAADGILTQSRDDGPGGVQDRSGPVA